MTSFVAFERKKNADSMQTFSHFIEKFKNRKSGKWVATFKRNFEVFFWILLITMHPQKMIRLKLIIILRGCSISFFLWFRVWWLALELEWGKKLNWVWHKNYVEETESLPQSFFPTRNCFLSLPSSKLKRRVLNLFLFLSKLCVCCYLIQKIGLFFNSF